MLRISRTGGYTDVDVVFDGKTVSILGKEKARAFASAIEVARAPEASR
jgi:hypothetical protein